MSLVNNRIYVDGKLALNPTDLSQTKEETQRLGGMAWIGYLNPTREEIETVALEFGLNELAVEDTINGGQRAKFEHYDNVSYTVLWPAAYDHANEIVIFGEIHIFTGPDFVITFRRSPTPDLARVRERLEGEAPWLLAQGPHAVLYGDAMVARRIFKLTKEVFAFQRASRPISDILSEISMHFENKGVALRLQQRINDVKDHDRRVSDRTEGFRAILQEAFVVHNTLVNQKLNEEMKAMAEASMTQNDEVKKISAWGAIFFAPTFVASVYGMNFDKMPELHWYLGYPMALGVMVLLSAALFGIFRKKDWI